MDNDTLKRAEAMRDWLIDTRRVLHRIPEPGNEEFETSEAVAQRLAGLGIPYTRVGTGLVALLEGEGLDGTGQDRCVALRADMDALPIEEPAGRPYGSLHRGYMHACGHDAHMTIALGVAKLLSECRSEFSGSVKFFFQPAEETTGGAEPLIAAGCLENPRVDLVLGLHVAPDLPSGRVEVRSGAFYGASDNLEIIVKGKSAHAAHPDQGIDAIVVAASVIQALQTIVSRSVSALDSAVISLGMIEGGTRNNILAGEVRLVGTIRTLSEDVRAFVHRRVEEVCIRTAEAFGAHSEVRISPSYPVLVNDERATELVRTTAVELLGGENVGLAKTPSLGVEDFAYYLRERPGTFWHLGCAPGGGPMAPLHSSDFDIDEACLPVGVAVQASAALRYLRNDQ